MTLELLAAHLAGVNRLGVAYSGGVDSSVLLAAAVRILGAGQVVPILGVSPSLAAEDRQAAHRTAEFIGVPVIEVVTQELANADYRANGPDRCFHCKNELFTRIDEQLVAEHRLDAVAYGENADDAERPDRPGSMAAVTHRVLRPLAAAGLRKSDVRRLAADWGLPSADKPAAPCLASRVPHFDPVTAKKLRQIEQAEQALQALGFAEVRVRHHGDVARIELPQQDISRAADAMREQVLTAVRSAGFRFVAVDLGGIQSGAFTLALVRSP